MGKVIDLYFSQVIRDVVMATLTDDGLDVSEDDLIKELTKLYEIYQEIEDDDEKTL